VIITLTPNPSVDRTMRIDALPRGAVIRSDRSRSEPSGKGVNVALALCANGYEALAVLPVGGPTGRHLVRMLRAAELPHVAVPIAGDVRSNISLVEPDGTVTKINEPGPALSVDEAERLTDAVMNHSERVRWLAGCGSLPAGAGKTVYAQLLAAGRHAGVRTVIDATGTTLREVLPHQPDLVKPNAEELASAVNRPLRTLGDVVDAAQVLRARGAAAVLASLGCDGAVLADQHGVLHGEAPVSTVVSAVGAGDALLAGFLAVADDRREALRTALTWAGAVVQHEGTLYLGAGAPTVAVKIHDDIDRARRLVEPQLDGHHD
jgi:1-phosphofructokinase